MMNLYTPKRGEKVETLACGCQFTERRWVRMCQPCWLEDDALHIQAIAQRAMDRQLEERK